MNAEAKCASLDRISNLPSSIIENILCLVSIRDAVRTSILSKNWRYNWVKIPKLEFNERIMFDYEADENQPSVLQRSFSRRISDRKQLRGTCKFFYAVLQVLLRHEGPIHEFSLILGDADDTCVEIDQIITHLARNNNALKKFTFETFDDIHTFGYKRSLYQLPRSIFSMHQLTDLNISCCSVDSGLISNGFGSLTNLSLLDIGIYKKALLPLLSSCPLLKRFKLMQTTRIGECYEDVTTIELLNCLPMIEHLSLYRWVFQCFNKNRDPKELPRALVHLKYFYLADMAFLDDDGLDTLSLVMRSSPGLEKIKLTVDTQYGESLLWNNEDFRIESTSLEICSDIWLEHLKELKIVDFSNMFSEMEFVKLILAKSPVLKKVSLVLEHSVTMDKELEILTILTSSPRVSPLAEVIVKGSVFWRGV